MPNPEDKFEQPGFAWISYLREAKPYWGFDGKHIIFIFQNSENLTRLYGNLSQKRNRQTAEGFFRIGKNCAVAYFEEDYQNFASQIQDYFKELNPNEYSEIKTPFTDLINGAGKISLEKIGAHIAKQSLARQKWFKQFKETYVTAKKNEIDVNSSATSVAKLKAIKRDANLSEICISALKDENCYSGYNNDNLLFVFKDKEFLKTFYKKILQYSRINKIALEQDLARFFKFDDHYLVVFYKNGDELSEKNLQECLEKIKPTNLDAENKNRFYKEMQSSGRKSMESIAGGISRTREFRVNDSRERYFELLKDYYHPESGKFFAGQESLGGAIQEISNHNLDGTRKSKLKKLTSLKRKVVVPESIKFSKWIDIFKQANCFHGKDNDLILHFDDSKYFNQLQNKVNNFKHDKTTNLQDFSAENFFMIAQQYWVILCEDGYKNLPPALQTYFIELHSKIRSYEEIAGTFIEVFNSSVGQHSLRKPKVSEDQERRNWLEKLVSNYANSEILTSWKPISNEVFAFDSKSVSWTDIFKQAECFHGKDNDLILYFSNSEYFKQHLLSLIKKLKNGGRKNHYFKAKNFFIIDRYLVIIREDANENLPAELSEYFAALELKIKPYAEIAESFVKVCNNDGMRYICQYAAAEDTDRKTWFEKFSTNYMDSELYKTAAADKKRKKISGESFEPSAKRLATSGFFPPEQSSDQAMDITQFFSQTEQSSPTSLDIEEIDPELLQDSIAALNF